MSSPRTQPWTTFDDSDSDEHAPATVSAPTWGRENDSPLESRETRAQPWVHFADPNKPAHSCRIAQAKALSVIGLEKAELVIYAAENR